MFFSKQLGIVSLILFMTLLSGVRYFNGTSIVRNTSRTYVVIGSGAAGQGAVKQLAKLDKQGTIVWISEEKENPYNKCRLEKYLSGSYSEHDITESTYKNFPSSRVVWKFGLQVNKIDCVAKAVQLSSGEIIPYDTLFLGFGRLPKLPSLDGIYNTAGVFNYYKTADIAAIKQYISDHNVQSAVIVGAGLCGLECVNALKSVLRIPLHLVSRGSKILGSKIDITGSDQIKKVLQENGVQLHLQTQISKLVPDQGVVKRVVLTDGKMIDADLVIFTTGGLINTDITKNAGLVVWNEHGNALKVDKYMQSSDPSIFAGGDMVMVQDKANGHLVHNSKWQDAIKQGEIAGYNMVFSDCKQRYAGVAPIHISSFLGHGVAYYGDLEAAQKTCSIVSFDLNKGHCTVALDDNKRIKAYYFIVHKKSAAGRKRMFLYGVLKSHLESQQAVDIKQLERLIVQRM